jgi:hypothetical protein
MCLSQEPYFSSQAVCANNLGLLYWNRGENEKAIQFWRHAARNDSAAARSNLKKLAREDPPPVDPEIIHQGKMADYTAPGATGCFGKLIGGGLY